ncbi:molybdenum cofactor biosynthesis protein [Burkholderia oklahomensis]|uniref:molybdenum cofactor biosynthesis protein n=1 Tax=Burkholderia oklahomensis TaxID=342113 RepID=UPI0026558843|nr:molybdenum cofactor biosynthesis protein [Burkholderia oklahomensis]MDN7674786.1 molybdenum cofactor biosynthesis protein [Burkholderia oklahomensis]
MKPVMSRDVEPGLRRREPPAGCVRLRAAIVAAMPLKSERHHFDLSAPPQIMRFMNMTGD